MSWPPRGVDPQSDVAPVILLTVAMASDDSQRPDGPERRADSTTPGRVNHVNLIGCDERFWRLGHGGPDHLPQGLQVDLNQALAERLGAAAGRPVAVGESVSIILPQSSEVPSESIMGRRKKTVQPQRFAVHAIIPTEGLGRFTLRLNQQLPYNAYVPLDWLQDRIKQPDRANALLVADEATAARWSPGFSRPEEGKPFEGGTPTAGRPPKGGTPAGESWRPQLEDYGIVLQPAKRGYINITSDRMILDRQTDQEIRQRLDGLLVQPVFTYVANSIALGTRTIPYSTITAVDFSENAPLGPFCTPAGKPIAPLGRDEIVLNSWAAEDLGAKPGDLVRVTCFEPESIHGELRERSVELRLAAVTGLSGAAADRDFTPQVPGVTDRRTINNWDPPFPFDSSRIRPQDEQYWDRYGATPKAFVSLATGQQLWGSRFGRVTSLRVAVDPRPGVGVPALAGPRKISRLKVGLPQANPPRA